MKLTLKDGSVRDFADGITALEAAASISEGLARAAVAAKVDGRLVGLDYKIEGDRRLEILTFNDEEGKEVYRHTCAHVLAHAVKSIYPTCKLAIGPAIKNGFYYDFDFRTPITSADLEKIEKEMARIIKANLPIKRMEVSKGEALKLMREESYKQELIHELPGDEVISFYKQGDFIDLCRGPHLPSTGRIKAFRLTMLAGAYWRGDEKNKMLTRIYGTAFDKKSELEEYLAQVEEAKKRDHNRLGRELEIFMTDENIGQGLPLLMPNGAKMMQILQRFVEDEEERRGYFLTMTPYLAKSNLYQISGHWDHYRDKMFVMGNEGDDEVLALRPMTCPFQYMIYKNGLKSYRDLPIRYVETSKLFRNEGSGEMHGLIRVRQFTLSDGHIICTPEQLEEEFKGALDLVYYMLDCLGLREEVSFCFSKWDKGDREKYIGTEEQWERTQGIMRNILDHLGIEYVEADGEAAFYGPKLDIQAKNVYGKEDTIITIQIDLFLAEKFDMTYIDQDGQRKYPIIIHRSSIGCYERTLAMLIEKYAGAFPLWISPVQVKVMSITDRTAQHASDFANKLKSMGIRAEADLRSEKIGYKIRIAQLAKVPYMVIIGDKEAENGTISVRSRKDGDLGAMDEGQFISRILREIASKT
ncbi:MAG: threonine--tRNA ligase [Clostridiales bacterium]|jgi:threonyl-tRNA synthetase|nr:threonine--tRNA ligase [Clostridiales bacterium]